MPPKQTVISYHKDLQKSQHADAMGAVLDAARLGSKITRDWFDEAHSDNGKVAEEVLGTEVKLENREGDEYEDLLTVADRECEEAMIPILKQTRNIPVVGEETGHEVPDEQIPEGGQRWLIDPIDGTFCFANGIPDYSITIALQEKQGGKWETLVGAVANPSHNEIYLADGEQAYLFQNDRAKKLSANVPEITPFSGQSMDDVLADKRIETCVFRKGDEKPEWKSMETNLLQRFGESGQSTYSTALMVAKIADNWVDGAIIGSNALDFAWDNDAAIHIAKTAGAKVKETEIDGEPCVFIANSQSLLTALEHATKQEHSKLVAQERGPNQAARG